MALLSHKNNAMADYRGSSQLSRETAILLWFLLYTLCWVWFVFHVPINRPQNCSSKWNKICQE